MNKKEQTKDVKNNKKIEKKKIKQEKKAKRKKSIGWKIFKTIIILLLLLILIAVGTFVYKVAKNGWGLTGVVTTIVGSSQEELKDLDKIYFLLVGISGCEEDYKLADTIMLCSYNPKTQQASILSIPRDTYVGSNKNNASASYKINAVYRNGENISGMLKSVSKITGIEVENYLIVDTAALKQVVDAIGGVEFDVPIDMKYDDYTQDLHIDLKAGYQKLNGQQAEWLVRFRHSNNGATYSLEYGDNDIGRMRTQREFITATLKQTLKPENLLKLIDIAKIAYNNINTNMTYELIKDYIPHAVSFNPDNIKTGTLPGTPEYCNKVWIYTVNKTQTKKLVEELFVEEEPKEESTEQNTVNNTTKASNKQSEKIKIEIQNGSGSTDKLKKLTTLLKEKGYNVTKTGNTNSTAKTSIINRTSQKTEEENNLKKLLGVGTITKKTNNSNVDFTIILGKDYK